MKRFKQDEINRLAEILKNDGVICVPTDTVYGVCAQIKSKKAHDKLMEVKNRPEEKLFPIMCSDINQIKEIAIVEGKASILIQQFMPGPITLVLNKKDNLPEFVNNGKDTIAIRMATSETLKELIQKVGSPLFMSSANQSGEPTCKSLDEVEAKCPKIDAILEGEVSFGMGSTIVDCTHDELVILREGPIKEKQLLEAIK